MCKEEGEKTGKDRELGKAGEESVYREGKRGQERHAVGGGERKS